MFVAMNRFQVNPDKSGDFEEVWKNRQSYIEGFDGFVHFALLKSDDGTDYISHSIWQSRAAFLNWTKSEAFQRAHGMGLADDVLTGHPKVTFYEPVRGTEAGREIVPATA